MFETKMKKEKPMKGEKKKSQDHPMQIPLKWRITDSVVTRFASNIVVQTIENEFKVSFFELKPEIKLSPSDPLPQEVLADCVASVIITADRMPKFIGALQAQLDKYDERNAARAKAKVREL